MAHHGLQSPDAAVATAELDERSAPSPVSPRIGPLLLGRAVDPGLGVERRLAVGAPDTDLADTTTLVVLAPAAPVSNVHEGEPEPTPVHPRLLPVVAAGRFGSATFVAQTTAGESLATRLARDETLVAAEAARLVAGIAAGLTALHAGGLAHGDVRPTNVWIDRNGEANLGGLRHPAAGDAVTDDADIAPSLSPYAAPERFTTGRSPLTDQFGVAATLHTALTGQPPSGATGTAFPRGLSERIPGRVREVIARGLAMNPAERFADVAAFAAAVSAALTAAADDLVTGAWEAVRLRDYPMARMYCEMAYGYQPGHPEATALVAHIATLDPFGGAAKPRAAVDVTTADAAALLDLNTYLSPPTTATANSGRNPWLALIVGSALCVALMVVLMLVSLTYE